MTETPACIRLPREIADLIINDLKDDKETLKACCLISRAADTWTASCRAHLFKDLTVHVHRHGTSVAEFVQFLDKAQFVAENIERLCLRRSSLHPVRHSIDVSVMRSLLSKLPHLRQLSLQRLYCALQQVSDVPYGCSNPKFKLETLKYRPDVDNDPLPAFLQILSLFSEVDELTLQTYTVRYGSLPLRAPPAADSPPTINSLIFESAEYPMLALARDVLRIASLRTLGLPFDHRSPGSDVFKAMLTQYGHNLHGLIIVVGDLEQRVRQKEWKSWLETLTALKSMTFIVASSHHYPKGDILLPSLANCINGLPPAPLVEINLIYAVAPKMVLIASYEYWEYFSFLSFPKDPLQHDEYFDVACCALPHLRKVFCCWTVGHMYSTQRPHDVDFDFTLWRSWSLNFTYRLERGFERLTKRGMLRLK
ncbi:hypothetical protein BDW22DRAFT_1429407 [Trametopsis cervina]|nr:hypothetical protein BDW22DRAFT_1429407 [Trametopsis cervina]